MSLIACPNCGREKVSDKAEQCPGCGFKIQDYLKSKKPKKLIVARCFLHICFPPAIIFLILSWGFFEMEENLTAWFFLIVGGILALIYVFVVVDRVQMLYKNPQYSLEEVKAAIDKRDKENIKVLQEMNKQMLEEERQQAILSQQDTTPWRMRYFTDPCPYCGHYKVRYAEWDDKKLSVAFWGIWSNKIGKEFHCDHCHRTFNN